MAAWPQVDQTVIKHYLRAANSSETRSLLSSILTFQSPAVDRTSTNSSSGWLCNPLLLSCWQISAEAHFQFSWQISRGFLPSEQSQAKLIHRQTDTRQAQDTGHIVLVAQSTYWWSKRTPPNPGHPTTHLQSESVVPVQSKDSIRFCHAHTDVCKFTHKHTSTGVCACVGIHPSKQHRQKTEHNAKVDWILCSMHVWKKK